MTLRKRWWTALIQRAFADTVLLHGLQVRILNLQPYKWEDEHLIEKLSAVLDLIVEHQPVWLERMNTYASGISVRTFPVCRAAFLPESRTILLDTYFVATFPVKEIALSVVHETTHAYLRARFPAVVEHPGREERLCRKAQLRFARVLEDGAEEVAWIEEMLCASDAELAPDIDWNEPYRRHALAKIDEVNPPKWLRRWLVQRVERRYPLRSSTVEPRARLTRGAADHLGE